MEIITIKTDSGPKSSVRVVTFSNPTLPKIKPIKLKKKKTIKEKITRYQFNYNVIGW